MVYLLDTGILLRLMDTADAHHLAIRGAFKSLQQRGDQICVGSQNMAEFWNVSTRPSSARGGFGRTIEITNRCLQFIERNVTVLGETIDVYREWRELVFNFQVHGAKAHDARLVALMNVWGINHIITLNGADFKRFPNVSILSPADILSQQP
jgi:predicted nucleic acid-binding protein